MRDFLLRMYAFMRRLPGEHGLHAAVAVAMAMLDSDDRMAGRTLLLSGGIFPEQLSPSFLDEGSNPSLALGAAIAMQAQAAGCAVIAPVEAELAQDPAFARILETADQLGLPIVFLMECDGEFSDDLDAQAMLGDIERIEADGRDAMRLMPAIRLAIDKAREGDGPTLVQCVLAEDSDGLTPADRLAEVLITEGYATPEELV